MNKRIISKSELDKAKLVGMEKIAGMVKVTLGPGGLPVLIQRIGQALDGSPLGPKITKDGVSVAEECSSQDPVEDVVIQAVKAICKKTNTDAGDGTTTAIVLGEAILKEIQVELDANSHLNPQLVRLGVEQLTKEIKQLLEQQAISVETTDDMKMVREVATISANGDVEVGKVIAEAFRHVGAEGVVTVDEGTSAGITLATVDGYQFTRGAQARDAFFNNQTRTQFEAENVRVLLYDGKILNYTDLLPFFEVLIQEQKANRSDSQLVSLPPVLIIANEFSREVLQFLIMQKQEAGVAVCAVEGPHVTHVRTGYYDDLAYYLGGERLGNGHRSLTAITLDDIGIAGKVVVDKYKTTLYDGEGLEEGIFERVDQLKALKQIAESPYDAQVISDRIAALTNGIAKIGVGGHTEMEIKELYDRIEDALNAARAAIQEGVVPGGGTTLLRIADALGKDLQEVDVEKRILSKALMAPFVQILSNIGLSSSEMDVIKAEILDNPGSVYDARSRLIVDAMVAGIIDPVKVTKTALENAVSIAALLSTAGGTIIFDKK